MNTVLIATAYIKKLLDDNTSIQCIEVWSRVLYARMKKGCGRNTFISKKGLEFQLPIYYYESEYISITKRYHPDKKQSTKKGKVCKQSNATKLQQAINISRQPLTWLFTGRGCSGIGYTIDHELFTKFTCTKQSNLAAKSLERLTTELLKTGYSDDELFGRYCTSPLDEQSWDDLRPVSNEEKVFQKVIKAMSDRTERLKQEYPHVWEHYTRTYNYEAGF